MFLYSYTIAVVYINKILHTFIVQFVLLTFFTVKGTNYLLNLWNILLTEITVITSLLQLKGAKDFAPASSKEFLDIQATVEYGFTLKHVHDMIRTYSQMHRTDKYSQHSSII